MTLVASRLCSRGRARARGRAGARAAKVIKNVFSLGRERLWQKAALRLRLPDITHKLARAATAGVTQHAAPPGQHNNDVVVLGAL